MTDARADPMPGAAPGSPVSRAAAGESHLGELFLILERRLRGDRRPADGAQIALTLEHYRCDAITGTLVDPYNGRRYRLTLAPMPAAAGANR